MYVCSGTYFGPLSYLSFFPIFSIVSSFSSRFWSLGLQIHTHSTRCSTRHFQKCFFAPDDRRVSGGCFRGPLWSACGGFLVLIRRLLARWFPVWILLRYCLRSLGCSCLLRRSVQLSFGVATVRICIRPRRPIVSGVKRIGRAMRPTCALAVDQDLETHCARLVRVSMRLVTGTADGHTASNARHRAHRREEDCSLCHREYRLHRLLIVAFALHGNRAACVSKC